MAKAAYFPFVVRIGEESIRRLLHDPEFAGADQTEEYKTERDKAADAAFLPDPFPTGYGLEQPLFVRVSNYQHELNADENQRERELVETHIQFIGLDYGWMIERTSDNNYRLRKPDGSYLPNGLDGKTPYSFRDIHEALYEYMNLAKLWPEEESA